MSRKSKELLEKRGEIVTKMQGLVDAADKENRGMNAEEREQFDRLDKEQSELKQRADDAYKAEQLAGQLEHSGGAGDPEGRGGNAGESGDARGRFAQHLRSWFLQSTDIPLPSDALAAAQRDGFPIQSRALTLRMDRGTSELGDPCLAPRNIAEVQRQLQRRREMRAQSVGTTTAGGHTVPDEAMAAIDTALLAFGGMRQVATIMTTDTGAELPIPTSNDTSNEGEIIDENSQVNEQDITFGQVLLHAYKYSSKMIKVSVELLQDSSINLPVYIGTRLGERLGRITNRHFTVGTGTDQPRGVVAGAADSGITLAAANNPTYDELMNIKHAVDPAYRSMAAWMFHDDVLLNIKKLKDLEGRPLWKPSLSAGSPDTIDNDPFQINQHMPNSGSSAKSMVYGQLSKYMIRETRDIVLLRLDERYAEFHQVAFLAFMRMDGDLIDAGTNPVVFADNPA